MSRVKVKEKAYNLSATRELPRDESEAAEYIMGLPYPAITMNSELIVKCKNEAANVKGSPFRRGSQFGRYVSAIDSRRISAMTPGDTITVCVLKESSYLPSAITRLGNCWILRIMAISMSLCERINEINGIRNRNAVYLASVLERKGEIDECLQRNIKHILAVQENICGYIHLINGMGKNASEPGHMATFLRRVIAVARGVLAPLNVNIGLHFSESGKSVMYSERDLSIIIMTALAICTMISEDGKVEASLLEATNGDCIMLVFTPGIDRETVYEIVKCGFEGKGLCGDDVNILMSYLKLLCETCGYNFSVRMMTGGSLMQVSCYLPYADKDTGGAVLREEISEEELNEIAERAFRMLK